MDKNLVYSMTAGEGATLEDFDAEFYEFNPNLCCDGVPIKVVKNFEDLLALLEEWDS